MSDYFNQIDPIGEGEDGICKHCGSPSTSYKGYCSRACYKYDIE